MPIFQCYIRILHVYVLERQELLQVVVNRSPRTRQTTVCLNSQPSSRVRHCHEISMPARVYSHSQALATFLLQYRTTPHSTTGVASCTLFCKRNLRTRLDLVTPDLESNVRKQQTNGKCTTIGTVNIGSWG